VTLQSKIVIPLTYNQFVYTANVVRPVQLYCLIDSPIYQLCILLRISVHQHRILVFLLVDNTAISIWIIIIKTKLLDSRKAINTPKLIIISSMRNPTIFLFIFVNICLFAT